MSEKVWVVKAELSDGEAHALAQFVKRIGWSEIRENAADETEAYVMRDALAALRRGLAEAGFAPR